ncbi:MAG: hypothetical protein AAGF76_05060, partial [Pseudomonadota bacterium]
LLAVAVVLSAGFRRQGFLGRVLAAVGAAVLLRVLGLATKSVVAGSAALWPSLYLPPLLGIAVAIWLLSSQGLAPRSWRLPGVSGGRAGSETAPSSGAAE